jgi:outer membrane lipoprotein SlyB
MKKIFLGAAALLLATEAGAFDESTVKAVHSWPVVKDHYKTVIVKKPYTVEECEERLVGGDKTGDTLGGAIVGAAIGNAIGKDTEATVAGAAIGGLIGHNKSDARPRYRLHCEIITRYDTEEREVYSHSTIRFEHDGKTYTETFYKNGRH